MHLPVSTNKPPLSGEVASRSDDGEGSPRKRPRPLSQALSGLPALPKGEPLAKPQALRVNRELYLYAKASPFEERLPPRRGKMSRSDKRGNLANAVSLRGFVLRKRPRPLSHLR